MSANAELFSLSEQTFGPRYAAEIQSPAVDSDSVVIIIVIVMGTGHWGFLVVAST